MAFSLESALARIATVDPMVVTGRVRAQVGLCIRASVPGVRVGDVVEINRRGRSPLFAEVVGFQAEDATLIPLGSLEGLSVDDEVRSTGKPASIVVGDALLGRVLNGMGEPADGLGPLVGSSFDLMRPPPSPLSRPRIERVLRTGIRAIDGLLTLGEGQRVGLFAGSGVGKSSLLGQIARNADVDVFVACLLGERGREVLEFVEDSLGRSGLAKGVVVVATSDEPALLRLRSAWVATAIAESFRDQGKSVLLMMDSVTRFARAAREVSLAAGEPPARRGYPPSVFSLLPRLLERAGTSERGSISALYTVLVEGNDMEEPIADEVRGLLDGHIVLDRELAARGRYPAIDSRRSLSRLGDRLVDRKHVDAAARVRAHVSTYEAQRDLVMLGAYKKGSDAKLDAALSRIDAIEAFLTQDRASNAPFGETVAKLLAL